ncbi:MAG: hypothetical protein JXR19_05850 [Bacteroidia bacterium]
MDNTQKYLSELHKEHVQWTKKLNFAKDEIKTFQNRLSEIVMANTKTEVLASLEHFQNQFIRQNEVIDEILHIIHLEEDKIVANAKQNNVATDHRKAAENEDLVDQMVSFEKIFAELKEEFKKYLSNVL